MVCGSCGQENPEGFQFCPRCGSPLAAAPEPRAERKIVTILFCDLVGFTAWSDGADPEDVRAILRPFHSLAKAEIERYGGTLDKFIGDAAMGVFGSPVAHEDDAERAVRAALRILEGIRAVNERRESDPLAVRIGVNTGEAVVTLSSGVQEGENVAGDVVNTASRLQTAAPVGGVLVGEATFRATRGAVRYEEADPVTAKGKVEPLRVWRAVGIRALPTISERPGTTPFVGRELERTLLEQTFLRALGQRAVQLVTVLGEPGVGKSRLVAELATAVPRLAPDTEVLWRRGRCLPYGEGITFWALGEIVKEQASILESDSAEDRSRKLSEVLEGLIQDPTDRSWLRERLAPLAGGEAALRGASGSAPGPPVERDEAFTAWRRFLEALANAHPLVTVFEDIHWADPAMLSFLEHLAQRASDAPLLVIATARPELYDRSPAWGAGMRNATTLSLPPLTEDETSALVSGLLRATSLRPEAEALLRDRSGGNPLYAEEFARALQDRGLVDGSGRLVADLDGLEFPETVQALIAARLDTLPRERKMLLQDASVIGRVFWSGAVAFVGEADEGGVREDLYELEKKELVRSATATSMRDQPEFAFWHALVRDVSYGQIPRAPRALKHRRVAAWLESIAGERIGDLAEILVHHAISAIELYRAVGEIGGLEDLEAMAGRYLRVAAARTMTLDVAKAEEQLRKALELTPAAHPDVARVLASLAEAAFQLGRLEEAERRYDEAIAGLRGQGDLRAAADAMVRRSVVLEYRGDSAAGRALMSEAIELLSGYPPGPELARALATNAGSLMISGRYQEVHRVADRAIHLAEAVGEGGAAARAKGFRGYARAVQGDPAGVAEQREALSALLSLGMARSAAIAYNNLGSCLTHVEGSRAALDVLREAVAFAEARGLREMVMALKSGTLTALFEVGEWDEVLRLGEEVVDEARRQGSGYDEVFAEADRAAVLAHRRGAQARGLCESIVEGARPLDDAPVLLWALIAAGVARQASGDRAGTVALVEEALETTRSEPILRAGDLPHLVRLAVWAGAVELAERLLEDTAEFRLERYRLARFTARAVLNEAQGRLGQAVESYEDAAGRWAGFGHALEEAHARFGTGRCLARLDRPDDSRGHFEAALAIFRRLGAEPAVVDLERRILSG
ncbi:MAG: AAA family ATPase [Actinobacteria bacterium]|nr:AAA family ATPase [Actinomycetota bacterium]